MGVNLWLDDERPCPAGWVRARTAVEAIELLAKGDVDEASLDHDLGHCQKCTGCHGYKSACGCWCHWTGYTVALWMAATGRWPCTKPRVHSANPAGRNNMQATIDRYFGARIAYPRLEFRMSRKEKAAAEAFEAKHTRNCTRFPKDGPDVWPSFSYRFCPTGIGTAVYIACSSCKKRKNITEYDAW